VKVRAYSKTLKGGKSEKTCEKNWGRGGLETSCVFHFERGGRFLRTWGSSPKRRGGEKNQANTKKKKQTGLTGEPTKKQGMELRASHQRVVEHG